MADDLARRFDTANRRDVVIFVCIAFFAAVICYLLITQINRADSSSDQATSLADQVAAACQSHDPAVRDALVKVGACEKAQEVQRDPAPTAGPTGPKGAPGTDGAPGPVGATGPAGPRGQSGENGSTGQDGSAGVNGQSGSDGRDGATGPQGPAGKDGADGSTGPAGPAGPAGPQGPQGDPGPTCPGGYSARPAQIRGSDGSSYSVIACIEN